MGKKLHAILILRRFANLKNRLKFLGRIYHPVKIRYHQVCVDASFPNSPNQFTQYCAVHPVVAVDKQEIIPAGNLHRTVAGIGKARPIL